MSARCYTIEAVNGRVCCRVDMIYSKTEQSFINVGEQSLVELEMIYISDWKHKPTLKINNSSLRQILKLKYWVLYALVMSYYKNLTEYKHLSAGRFSVYVFV